jgi:hypothetical protein
MTFLSNARGLVDKQFADAHGRLAAIVVDDSIFTGASYRHISAALSKAGLPGIQQTFLLPLTLDCQSLKYYYRYTRTVEQASNYAQQSIAWASKLNDVLPFFRAFGTGAKSANSHLKFPSEYS